MAHGLSPATHLADLGGFPDSQFGPGSGVVSIWGREGTQRGTGLSLPSFISKFYRIPHGYQCACLLKNPGIKQNTSQENTS